MKYRDKKKNEEHQWAMGQLQVAKCNGRGREAKDRKTIFKYNGQDFCKLDKIYKTHIFLKS